MTQFYQTISMVLPWYMKIAFEKTSGSQHGLYEKQNLKNLV